MTTKYPKTICPHCSAHLAVEYALMTDNVRKDWIQHPCFYCMLCRGLREVPVYVAVEYLIRIEDEANTKKVAGQLRRKYNLP